MSYKSKYKGIEIDAALDKANTALQEHQDISGKQDKINDLEDIRQGASLGKTSVQSNEGYATTTGIRHKDDSVLYTFSGSVNELEGDYIVPVLHEGFVDAKGIYDDANELKFAIKHSDWESEGDYVIPTMEEVDAKQDTLVSGTNIKTINGESLLGSGDITISRGGADIVEVTDPTNITLTPNCTHVVASPISSVSIADITEPTELTAQYSLHFFIGESAGQLALPDGVLWANGTSPTLEASTGYELSIVATSLSGNYIFKAVLTPFKSV